MGESLPFRLFQHPVKNYHFPLTTSKKDARRFAVVEKHIQGLKPESKMNPKISPRRRGEKQD
jgi:hypothetical protein